MSTIEQFDLKDFIVISLVVALFTMICLSGKETAENKVLGTTWWGDVNDWIKDSRNQDPWAPMWNRSELGPPVCRPKMFFGNWKWPSPSTCDTMSPNK